MARRISEGHSRSNWKAVASDLIIERIEQIENTIQIEDYENQAVHYILRHSGPFSERERAYARLYAHSIFWNHIQLALGKGMDPKTALKHVYHMLVAPEKKKHVINRLKFLLNCRGEWK